MKIKARQGDFKVDELLHDGVIRERGEYRVYRVTKRKRTSIEAASILARLAGVVPADVAMAGLKDRQGVTTQYMSIARGRPLRERTPELTIETVGSADHALSSEDTRGNSFEIVVRDLDERGAQRMRTALPFVREHGLPSYFDEQRFGNLRHGQGWILVDLMHGRVEGALQRLLGSRSTWDGERERSFKTGLQRDWGDWRACRDHAGRFGAHHSVFDHLRKSDGDFAGAFRHIATRVRLIHLFAYQSHLWNRVVAEALEKLVPPNARFNVHTREGRLVFPKYEVPLAPPSGALVPLPGAGLEGVTDPGQRALFTRVLERDGLTPEQFRVDGVPGFQLKWEERPLVVRPQNLRMRPAEPDPDNSGRRLVRLRFELPRGTYATLVVRRLVGPASPERRPLPNLPHRSSAGPKRQLGAPRYSNPPRKRRD